MYSTIRTAALDGISAMEVQAEADVSSGMPCLDLVGLLAPEVREAKERVRTALHSCGIQLPAKHITINLSPANVRKNGTGFDLPIAIALLVSLGYLPEENCRDRVFIGELGLNGRLIPVNGILPIVSDGCESGVRAFVLPKACLQEAGLVKGAEVYGFSDLRQVIDFLNGSAYQPPVFETESAEKQETEADFSEVMGQTFLKRACEVAAAGMHNLLMIGPPGSGKTMISTRMAGILPPLTEEEQLELSKIYSVCGLLTGKKRLIQKRPFRSPHHTITQPGLAGGGNNPKPGEISLAHHGVLFLDELPEFQKSTLEVLRQPMEDRQVHITRVGGSVNYPSDFLLLASMNPCNCGYYPDMQKCRCTPGSIRRYLNRISQPLIDRMDICVEAPAVNYSELSGQIKDQPESSADIRKRVEKCHRLQFERYADEDFKHNSRIPAVRIPEYCALGREESAFMEDYFRRMSLTARTYHKLLRVARTIADLDGSEKIRTAHLREAVCCRMDAGFWKGGAI